MGAAKTNGPEEIKGWRTDKILIGPSTYQRPIFSNGSSRQAYGSPWTPRPGAPINCLDTLLPSSCSLGECWGPDAAEECGAWESWPEPGYIRRQRTGPTSSTLGEKEDGSTLETNIFFLNSINWTLDIIKYTTIVSLKITSHLLFLLSKHSINAELNIQKKNGSFFIHSDDPCTFFLQLWIHTMIKYLRAKMQDSVFLLSLSRKW